MPDPSPEDVEALSEAVHTAFEVLRTYLATIGRLLPPGTATRTEYATIPDNATTGSPAPHPWPRRGPHHTHQRHIHTTPWTPLDNNPTDQLRP